MNPADGIAIRSRSQCPGRNPTSGETRWTKWTRFTVAEWVGNVAA
jgi:hypothetical protein